MKKVLVVLVMMGMLVCGCGANSGTDTENTGTGNSSKTSSITEEDLNEVWDSAKEYYEGIEPLEEEVTIEVLAEPKSGFLGFGSKPAKVRLTEKARKNAPIYDIEEEERKAAPPAAPKAAEAAPAEDVTAEVPEEPVEEPAAGEAEPARGCSIR